MVGLLKHVGSVPILFTSQTLKGVTPLMVAARGGHLDCERLLLENNADTETEDAEGWTALHYAATSGNESIMKDLLDRRAIMSTIRSRRGQSPISIALNSGNADTARILLDKDASSIHRSDSAGLTPMHLATVNGLTSIIEKLVSQGAGLNPQSHDGQTPLHAAIRLCHCKKRLVEVTTALKQIQQDSDDDISPAEALIQFLINQGSKIDMQDNNGFTPVQYAKEERIRQMVFRSLSEDDVHTFRDLPIARYTESHRSIGCEGGILHLDSCDVTMSIPPRTVQAGSCHGVSIALVTDDPPPIREREFLTGHGIDITFPAQWRYSQNQPITLSLPHAATFLKSNDVHADIIWKQTESTSVNREDSFGGNGTQCIIKEREVKLVIDATSVIQDKVQLWIPIKLHDHALGKRMVCTPFLPFDIAHGEDITLRMFIHEDIPYIVQKIQEEEENMLYHQVHPGRCFGLEPESSDLELECNGKRKIVSTKDLFNRQKTLVSLPITTETNARTQIINVSVSATSTNQPKISMAFVVIRTGFSTDIHSNLDEMVPGLNFDLSNVEDIPSGEFITKEMNTDQYYHLGLALGLSYQILDSIQFRCRQHEEAGVYTPNQKAAIFMIRYWKYLQHSKSLADDHLREVVKSVSDSGGSAPVLIQRQRAEKKHDTNVEDLSEFRRVGPRTIPTEGIRAYEAEIPGARGHWEESLHHKRPNTPSVRSDSLSSFSTLLEEEEGCFPKRYGAHIPGSARAHTKIFSTSRQIPDKVQRVLSIDEVHEDEEKDHSNQAIFAWMKSGEAVKPADFRPYEYTSEPKDDEGKMIASVHHISSPSALQDEISVQNLESRDDLSEDADVIRLEKHGIEVRIPPNEAYTAKDITVEPIHDIPPELVLKETEAIISVGLRMSPSDATFDVPVIVTMPHSGIFTKPEAAEVVTYYRKSETTDTSLGDTVSASLRPSASMSADTPPKDASATAGKSSTSRARFMSIDGQHEDKDKYHSDGIFDHTGGKLHIPSHGLTLFIPPGALPEGSNETITLDVLTDIPPGITLKHDETLVTYGFQCLPSGLQFESEKPVRLEMPHCAILIDPSKVEVVLYSLNHEGEADRIIQTSRTCRVTYSHVEISLEHFSKGIAVFRNTKKKRMSLMPFLPKIMPQCRELTLEFRMVNKPHGVHWRDVHEIKENATYQPAKDDDDEMSVKRKDMEVTCQLSDSGTLKENIEASFTKMTKHTLYFELDFNGRADDLLVKLKVKQSTRSMDIKFRTHFLAYRGITETSLVDTVFTSPRPSPSTSAASPFQDASAPAGEFSFARAREVSDSMLSKLARYIPSYAYNTFSAKLGIEHNQARSILNKSNYEEATRECMARWMDRSTRSLADLHDVLREAELEGLIVHCY